MTPPSEAENGINLLDYLLLLLKHKNTIFKATAVAAVLACITAFFLPNIYISTARILPPVGDNGGLSAMLAGSGVGDLAALAGISVGNTTGDLYAGMLQSRTIADAVIDRFQLMEVYDQEYRLKTYEKLSQHVAISLGKNDGIISISVEDEDPQRASDMANAYVEELKKINVRLNLSSAGRERVFLEERLVEIKQDLAQAEDRLKVFQEQNKAIRIDAQATAIIDAIAALKAQLTSKEVELGILLSYQTEQNPQVKALREGIAQLKNQLKNLERTPDGKSVSEDIFIATSEVPVLGIQYARLMRDFKVEETLFELLTKQYEVAKITEARSTSTIQVLDEAFPPDRKSKPKRSLIVILVTFATGFVTIFVVFTQECIARMPLADRQRWEEIQKLLPRWSRNK